MENNANQEKLRVISPTVRELDLEISPEQVKKEYEKVLKDYVARVKLPGFRKGYAPREMVQRMFEAEIKEAVLDNLIPDNLRQELESLKIIPVNVPTVKSIDFSLDNGLRYKVSFEVWPEFDLPADYLGKKVEKEKIKVEEAEIEAVLNRLRENLAEYLPVTDRGIQHDDYVVIEIQGRDTSTKKFMPVEKVVVLVGHADNEPRLNEVLPGLKPGDEKNFIVKYPDDYRQKKFAGKEVEYRLKVLEIKEKKLPELNDDFARMVDEVEGLEVLKDKIRQDLSRHKEEEARNRAIDRYLEGLATEINLQIPESMVSEEAEAIISRQFRQEEMKKIPSDLWPRLMEQARKQAEANLKHHILLRKISAKEDLAVSPEEFEQELKKVSESRNIPLDQLKKVLAHEERTEEWKLNLLLRKTVDFLVSRVIIE